MHPLADAESKARTVAATAAGDIKVALAGGTLNLINSNSDTIRCPPKWPAPPASRHVYCNTLTWSLSARAISPATPERRA